MKKSSTIHSFCGLACLATALLAGCSESAERPTTYPVSGTVMYNGEPIAGASVAFWTEGASRAATGTTDSEGKFKLSMFEANDGAEAGSHTITVSKKEAAAESSTESTETVMNDPTALANMSTEGGAPAASKSLIPTKYADRKTTPLTETVTEGENQFVLQLAD